jgi:hypothetical protein
MLSHVEVQDSSPVVSEYQEDEEDVEGDCGHREEVDGNEILDVIVQECPPGLARRLAVTGHVLGYRGLREINAKLEQFAMNPRSAPERIARDIRRIS